MNKHHVGARLRAWASIAGLLWLAGCGAGDVGSGGTGTPLQGTAIGTVNGFGSVIVDGNRFDDRNTVAVSETGPGQDSPMEVRLGHRVEVEFTDTGAATRLRVETTLVGPISSVVSPGHFVILGQPVIVNGNPSAGPVTQLGGGYVSAADVAAGDVVEVHGLLVPQGAGWAIQATRIDHDRAMPEFVKVTGVITGLGTGGQFKIGGLMVITADAAVFPAGTGLVNGQVVAVLGRAGNLNSGNSSSPNLVASQIRIRSLPPGAGQSILSGTVSNLDAAAQTFIIGAVKVDYAAAAPTLGGARWVNGAYVRVLGTARPDNTLVAESVVIRDGSSESEAELRGTITGFNATTKILTIRDVAVDASHATLTGCPATGLADGLFAEVHGSLNSTMVVAQQVECESDPVDGVVEREGSASVIDLSGKSFVLSSGGRTQVVRWTIDTFFRTVTPDTLEGKLLSVEGTLRNGELIASKIKLAD